ncbi:hypothetical protein [Senegalia massiliensis]|nr:hypothetical protein [Senegalia massiliensis]
MIIITYDMTFVILSDENIHYNKIYMIGTIVLTNIRGDIDGCKSRKCS